MSWADRVRSSLKGRLLFSLSVGLGSLLVLGFFLLHDLVRDELYQQLDARLTSHFESLVDFVIAHPGGESAAEFDPEFRAKAHEDFFQVWDTQGQVLARSDSSAGRDIALPDMPLDSTPRLYDLTLPDGHRGRGLAQQVLLPADDPRGSITVVMATETESLDALETRVHWLLAIVGAAIVLVAAVVATIAVERSLGPVRELAALAERIDPEGPPVELQTEALPAELKPVARKLGSLVRRLFEVLERERRFSRNVAHELRNPLAEMRMLADVGTMATSLDEARRRLQEVGASSTELEQIVESLLALARYESGREQPQPEPVELAGEVRRHLELSEKTAGQRSLSVQRHLPREHWVLADSSLLQRLVANLTSNAIAHAPGGSLVRVEINGDGSLVLENDAPNLKPGDLPRLGERFYRIDTGNGMTHAGLGLSLAQGIADLLGLKLELSLREDQRLVVTLSGFEPLPG